MARGPGCHLIFLALVENWRLSVSVTPSNLKMLKEWQSTGEIWPVNQRSQPPD